VDKVT